MKEMSGTASGHNSHHKFYGIRKTNLHKEHDLTTLELCLEVLSSIMRADESEMKLKYAEGILHCLSLSMIWQGAGWKYWQEKNSIQLKLRILFRFVEIII